MRSGGPGGRTSRLDTRGLMWYGTHMTNKEIADQLLRGKKKAHLAKTLKLATAIRVAGHRLGGVLTVQKQKRGFRLIKSVAKVWHRRKVKAAARRRAR